MRTCGIRSADSDLFIMHVFYAHKLVNQPHKDLVNKYVINRQNS